LLEKNIAIERTGAHACLPQCHCSHVKEGRLMLSWERTWLSRMTSQIDHNVLCYHLNCNAPPDFLPICLDIKYISYFSEANKNDLSPLPSHTVTVGLASLSTLIVIFYEQVKNVFPPGTIVFLTVLHDRQIILQKLWAAIVLSTGNISTNQTEKAGCLYGDSMTINTVNK
jgi:hypothetical protein